MRHAQSGAQVQAHRDLLDMGWCGDGGSRQSDDWAVRKLLGGHVMPLLILLLLALLIFGVGAAVTAVKWAIIIALIVLLVGFFTGRRSSWW